MAIKDYDRIIQLVEENITKKKTDLVGMATTMLHLSTRDLNEILKFIDPEGRTLPDYIFQRKIFRALEDFAAGMSKDDIAEKYQYSDTSHFGGYVVNLCGGKTPQQHRKDGYICPPPLYLKDLLEDMTIDTSGETELAYQKELIGFVDEITRLKNELSKEKKKEFKKAMDNPSMSKKDVRLLSVEIYNEFMKVEDLRSLYGFNVKTILRLYNESVSSGISLEDLCDQELETMYYTGSRTAYDDGADSLAYHVLYEGDSMQNWEYFAGDDEIDDRDSMREENLYADVEVYTDFEDICYEAHDEYAIEDDAEDEEDPTPTDEQLKEWFGIDASEPGDTFA